MVAAFGRDRNEPAPATIQLPDGFQPEGIAIGERPYAYFGSRVDGDIYRVNLGTGRGTSMNELAAMVLDRLAPGQRPLHASPPGGELRFSVANIEAARRELGFAPSRSLAADLDEVIAAVTKTARSAPGLI